ncbi:hypothetical protein Poly24_44280 [Rosistilla carotiformis]|uniref:Uncharacterized protein n=1 Tax=Rosistilla carotiformis TaxID=2528017 RepID=A0A518JYT1_9BACT|nr:hypothetical protein [Rosistilla carotiformis]QDV70702.1 hypothetical protein Poly24_44280 [Rosistilla carotiformis]
MLMRNPEMTLVDPLERDEEILASRRRETLFGQVIAILVVVIAILLRSLC